MLYIVLVVIQLYESVYRQAHATLPSLVVNKINHVCTFCLYGLKDCNCNFHLIFSCFNWFSYCRGKCICAGQGNTIVSHFVVQRADMIVAIVCVPCGPRRSLIYACA